MNHNQSIDNPFHKYRDILEDGYATAESLRAVSLNLYNGSAFPLIGDELGRILRGAEGDHLQILFEILEHYATYGEGCRGFKEVLGALADRERDSIAASAGYDDATNRRRERNERDIPFYREDAYWAGYKRGERDFLQDR